MYDISLLLPPRICNPPPASCVIPPCNLSTSLTSVTGITFNSSDVIMASDCVTSNWSSLRSAVTTISDPSNTVSPSEEFSLVVLSAEIITSSIIRVSYPIIENLTLYLPGGILRIKYSPD